MSPTTFGLSITVHVYVVPIGIILFTLGTPVAGIKVNVSSLQIGVIIMSSTKGLGLTDTSISNGKPTHPSDSGVTV
jgi:hypothetical protein